MRKPWFIVEKFELIQVVLSGDCLEEVWGLSTIRFCTMYDHHSMNVGDNILKTFIPHDQIGDTCIL